MKSSSLIRKDNLSPTSANISLKPTILWVIIAQVFLRRNCLSFSLSLSISSLFDYVMRVKAVSKCIKRRKKKSISAFILCIHLKIFGKKKPRVHIHPYDCKIDKSERRESTFAEIFAKILTPLNKLPLTLDVCVCVFCEVTGACSGGITMVAFATYWNGKM